MRLAIEQPGRFSSAFKQLQLQLEEQMRFVEVPVPRDGACYSHEQHKKNYQLIYNAGVLYQLTQESKYADFVANMLLRYAQLYPTLDLHPAKNWISESGKIVGRASTKQCWCTPFRRTIWFILACHNKTPPLLEQLLVPVALFLSEGQPSTFNKVHNRHLGNCGSRYGWLCTG